jgi:D-amino-acid oxidase
VHRRELIRNVALGAAGVLAGIGCAPRQATDTAAARTVVFHPRGGRTLRAFAPVRAAHDRIVRTLAGSRPFRPGGFVVRAERFDDRTVIHNYGHGGGGLSLCWGSSAEAASLAEAALERRCAVIGAGALGLTSARLLQDRGFDVILYARELPPDTTSNVAGAQWSPFTVHDTARVGPDYGPRFERVARFSHRYFQSLIGPTYGVRWIENVSLSEGPPRPRTDEIADLFPECEDFTPGEHPFGSRWLRCFNTMFIEPAPFLNQLARDFLLRGGRIIVRAFHHRDEVLRLEERLVINCTGLGARALFGDDELIPIKGELVLLVPQPEIDYILLGGEFYMFPRSDGILLGGSRGVGDWSVTPDPAVVARIIDGHRRLFGVG